MGHVSASLRLAAHQSGRAIAAGRFDVRQKRGVKYVATYLPFLVDENLSMTSATRKEMKRFELAGSQRASGAWQLSGGHAKSPN
jgi:hypothetical protein